MSIPLYQSGGGSGSGAVSSVFTRTGAVVAAANDYSFSQISGSVAASQLPNPSATTLGGIESLAAVASKWINTISTSGVPSATQPAFSDISGSVAASQLPNPSATTLGGIQSIAATSHKWINAISTAGVPTQTQPALADLSDTPAANLVVASPNGSSGALTARALVAADLPNYAALGGFFGGIDCSYGPTTSSTSTASPSSVANNVHVLLFVVLYAITVNKIVYNVATLSASDKWAFGIYSSDGNTKLIDSGVISPTATNTALSITLGSPVTLAPGEYYFAQTSSGITALSTYQLINANAIPPMMNKNRNRTGIAANASVAGVLPATLGAINTATVRSPMLVYFEN